LRLISGAFSAGSWITHNASMSTQWAAALLKKIQLVPQLERNEFVLKRPVGSKLAAVVTQLDIVVAVLEFTLSVQSVQKLSFDSQCFVLCLPVHPWGFFLLDLEKAPTDVYVVYLRVHLRTRCIAMVIVDVMLAVMIWLRERDAI